MELCEDSYDRFRAAHFLHLILFPAPLLSCGSHQAESCVDCAQVNGFESGSGADFFSATKNLLTSREKVKAGAMGTVSGKMSSASQVLFPKL